MLLLFYLGGQGLIKICYVCSGNTCRSIMAERLTKVKLKKLGIKNIKVSSRGINASGENIAENAKKVLKRLGASAVNRKSVKLRKVDVDTLYVTMTKAQKQALGKGKIIAFAELVGKDIIDPYGQDEMIYYETAQELEKGIQVLLEKILKYEVKI